ncbi:MAG: divalent-cation tolerance protein CutA [Streptomycetales bacterium]
MAEYVQVVTTTDSAEEASRLARGVVEARLAACVQVVGPVEAFYRWEGKVESDNEWQVQAKTTGERLAELEAYIRERHSYDVPEIVATPIVGGSEEYLSWLGSETSPAP